MGKKVNKILQSDFWVNTFGKTNLIISVFSLLFFSWLSYQVLTEKILDFDENFLDKLPQVLPDNFFYIARGFYFIGEAEVAVFVVIFSLIFLAWKRYWLEAQVVAISSLSVLILVDQILKPIFYRRRPLDRLIPVHGRSFPSGHASGNLLLYFLLIYIISVKFPKLRIPLYALATVIMLLIGLGSMYLRTHWLTDILGGYCLGYILFTISIAVLKISDPKYR